MLVCVAFPSSSLHATSFNVHLVMHQYAGGWMTKDQQLVAAVKSNQPAQIKRLLALKADPNWVDPSQASHKEMTLHHACQIKSSEELVKLLLGAGAAADATDIDDWRPAHWASYHNAEASLQCLIDAGADVNAQNRRGETPLHWACKNNCARAVRTLGASPVLRLDMLCAQQESAREWAVRHRSEEALKALVALTANESKRDSFAPVRISQ